VSSKWVNTEAIVRAILLGSLLGLTTGLLAARMEKPADAVSCSTPPYPTNIEDTKDSNNHRGSRVVSMKVADSNSLFCARISSMGLIQDGLNFIELGWQLRDTGADPDPRCSNTDNSFHEFHVSEFKGTYRCKFNGPTLAASSLHDFKVENLDFDTCYDYYVDGTFWESDPQCLNFNAAVPVINSERHSSSDGMYTHFNLMQYENSSGWHNWTSTTCLGDDDPGFKNVINSDTDVETPSGSGPC